MNSPTIPTGTVTNPALSSTAASASFTVSPPQLTQVPNQGSKGWMKYFNNTPVISVIVCLIATIIGMAINIYYKDNSQVTTDIVNLADKLETINNNLINNNNSINAKIDNLDVRLTHRIDLLFQDNKNKIK